jgi:soluble lytic murein transglycosylase-like protein
MMEGCLSNFYLHPEGYFYKKSVLNVWVRRTLMCLVVLLGMFFATPITTFIQDTEEAIRTGVMRYATPEAAYVSFVRSINPEVSMNEAARIVNAAVKYGRQLGVEPPLLLAVAATESTFKEHSISSAGAVGLYQVLIKVHIDKIVEAKKVVGTPEPFDVEANTFMGAKVLKDCIEKRGNVRSGLACYNGTSAPGEYSDKVLERYKKIGDFT